MEELHSQAQIPVTAATLLHLSVQCRESSTPKHTFLGVSPPVRASGAANPMAQDRNWRSNAHKASNNNLQVCWDSELL